MTRATCLVAAGLLAGLLASCDAPTAPTAQSHPCQGVVDDAFARGRAAGVESCPPPVECPVCAECPPCDVTTNDEEIHAEAFQEACDAVRLVVLENRELFAAAGPSGRHKADHFLDLLKLRVGCR